MVLGGSGCLSRCYWTRSSLTPTRKSQDKYGVWNIHSIMVSVGAPTDEPTHSLLGVTQQSPTIRWSNLACTCDLTCRDSGLTSTPVRSGHRSGGPGNRRSGPGLRSGGSRDLDLRPETCTADLSVDGPDGIGGPYTPSVNSNVPHRHRTQPDG